MHAALVMLTIDPDQAPAAASALTNDILPRLPSAPGGGFRVDGVGRATPATVLTIGSVHLDDRHTVGAQIASQPRPPRPAALDAHYHEFAEAA
jgi:hypothetical protein